MWPTVVLVMFLMRVSQQRAIHQAVTGELPRDVSVCVRCQLIRYIDERSFMQLREGHRANVFGVLNRCEWQKVSQLFLCDVTTATV